MTTLTLLVFLLLLARQAASSPSAPTPSSAPAPTPPLLSPAAPTPAVVPAAYHPPPWPQVVPAGLPPFPGPGWTPDEPPGPGVVSRAWALLSQLWSAGAGTFKTEQTSGRWITYRATPMGAKKGVVAYRLKNPPSSTDLTQA